MKKLVICLILVIMCGCSTDEVKNISEIPHESSNTVNPIVVYNGNDKSTGYVIGGVVDGKIISLQDDDNYKKIEPTGSEKYMFFPVHGAPIFVCSKDVNTQFISATGSYEIQIEFEKTDELLNNKYVGIGNVSDGGAVKKEMLDDEGSFILDFDGDGQQEKIDVKKSIDNTSIILNNQQGKTQLSKFVIDDVYTNSYDIFAVDIDEDGTQELIISLSGHDYSTEIYKITSDSNEKVLGYYMGN